MTDAAKSLNYQVEFPDFDPATMPETPTGFEDVSWRNDACPNFFNEGARLAVFVDFANAADREHPEAARFTLHYTDENGLPLAVVHDGDDWADILAAIEHAPRIAKAFAQGVETYLTTEQFQEVRRRNATREYMHGDCCASHDFCDANVYLDAAFTLIMDRAADLQNERDLALINASSALAKAAHFTAESDQ